MANPRKAKRRVWLWLTLTVLVVAVGLGVASVARGSGAKLDPTQIGKVERGDIARSVVATGKVQPITKVEVKSKASGIVTRLDTDINAHVHPGQVLAQLDQVEILAQVAAQLKIMDQLVNQFYLGVDVFFYQIIENKKTGDNSYQESDCNIVPAVAEIIVYDGKGYGNRSRTDQYQYTQFHALIYNLQVSSRVISS